MNEIKQNNLEVKTRYGVVEGFSRKGCACWYGIPFAKPPVGELAFRHPVPPEPWEDVRKAYYGSANPIQSKGDFSIGNNSQDCLYLNVFVPEEHTGPLPVMVWIYGGAYNQGGAGAVRKDSAELLYDMALFARESGCAVVTFNFRQNLYGFLNLHFLDERFDQNNGLFDQIMALRFVKENIAPFGGDPDNVTLFGQSAGASSVLALMAMKEAEGLFHKAIVMSANVEHFYTEEVSRRYTNDYLKFAGVSRPEKLAALSEQRVCAINERYAGRLIMKGDVRCAFSPVIDGVTLKEEPKKAVQRCNIPLLIGTVYEEANLFIKWLPRAILPLAPRVIGLKVEKGEGTLERRVSDALTQHIYIRPMLEILEGYSGPAWCYEYRYVYPGSTMGCYHTCELPVLFGIDLLGKADDPESVRMGQKMRRIWGTFARDGDPGWRPYSEGKLQFPLDS